MRRQIELLNAVTEHIVDEARGELEEELATQ